jgi:hypothetical protein
MRLATLASVLLLDTFNTSFPIGCKLFNEADVGVASVIVATSVSAGRITELRCEYTPFRLRPHAAGIQTMVAGKRTERSQLKWTTAVKANTFMSDLNNI